MNTFSKDIKNSNGTIDKVIANSNDNYDIMIGENYKLIKFSGSKKSFKDTMFGTDIGIHSHGFVNIAIIAMLLALSTLTLLYFNFRI
jgi:hypothetical protein